ncbi:hypothetical protein FHW69_003407 [Luteibacter sp. Sphag1AF]|uniref:Pr6Pr family membrane protein n=1 Tax=Luteibacter sp. Sphag1AF TaxID=2587031 RepID=UPI00160B12E1|nr:Pr6Pr family membrane protein [Luteibacter sp. Sphag1AF]MBB3228765.1 hypothetical protein [Luteibacter sp. Sphag1AF]
MNTTSPVITRSTGASTAVALVIAAVAWFAVGLQYWLMLWRGDSLNETVRFASYFTIISNIIVALVCTFVTTGGNASFMAWWRRPRVMAATAVYILVTGLVYAALLQRLYHPQGPQLWADMALHKVVPVAYLLWWAFLTPHGALRWRDAFAWLVLPAVYLGWTLAHGALSGFYPYPFINVAQLGYPHALLNALGVGVLFYTLGLMLVLVDRLLGTKNTAI